METSAAAKSKKIRDWAALILPNLISLSRMETDPEILVHKCWTLAEKMYGMEVLTYDRIMAEAGYSTPQPSDLASVSSATAARRGSIRDV